MSRPLFTIVIPTYNRAGIIVKTINSVLAQTFEDFEVIVVDDGSTDNTEAVIETFTDPRIRYIKKLNEERGAARNAGARIATGKFVNFVDSDDLLYTHHTEEARKTILQNPEINIFHLGYDVKDGAGKVLRDSSNVSNINHQLLTGNVLSCNGVFIERITALENPFSEKRIQIEDWELWLRLAAKYKFLHVPVITSTVVSHHERSEMSLNIEKIKMKTASFIDFAITNKDLATSFGSNVNKIVASALTYTALHLAIAKSSRREILSFLLRGIAKNRGEIISKRFLVILKLLLFR
jgi:glycosyltransferase involved in cell wall biosynthesis